MTRVRLCTVKGISLEWDTPQRVRAPVSLCMFTIEPEKASDGLRDYGNDLSGAKQVCHLQ